MLLPLPLAAVFELREAGRYTLTCEFAVSHAAKRGPFEAAEALRFSDTVHFDVAPRNAKDIAIAVDNLGRRLAEAHQEARSMAPRSVVWQFYETRARRLGLMLRARGIALALSCVRSDSIAGALEECLAWPDSYVRGLGIQGVLLNPQCGLAPKVIGMTEDAFPEVQLAAMRALPTLQLEKDFSRLIRACSDRTKEVRLAAIKTLEAHSCVEAGGPLARLLHSECRDTRCAAAKALATVCGPNAIGDLTLALERERDWRARKAFRAELARLGASAPATDEDLRYLREGLSGTPGHQLDTVRELGAMEDPRAQDLLIQGLAAKFDGARYRAAVELTRRPQRAAVPALLKALRDSDSLVRMQAVRALIAFKEPEHLPHLTKCLDDPEMHVRHNAIHAVGTIGGRDMLPLLREKLLKEKEPSVRRHFESMIAHIEKGMPKDKAPDKARTPSPKRPVAPDKK